MRELLSLTKEVGQWALVIGWFLKSGEFGEAVSRNNQLTNIFPEIHRFAIEVKIFNVLQLGHPDDY